MKRDFLAELGLEKDVIDKIMSANGEDINKAKADVETLKAKLDEREKTIVELNEQIKDAESDTEVVKELQKKVADYEQAEKDRVQAEKDAEADKVLTENILNTIGDKQFVNDYTKDSIIAQIKSELAKAENKGKGTNEIFEAITKDAEGIFKNPQQERLEIPPTTNVDNSNDDAFIRQVMGLPPKN